MVKAIEELLKLYPAPTHLRMDNGPEFIAKGLQVVRREWLQDGLHPTRLALGEPIRGIVQQRVQG